MHRDRRMWRWREIHRDGVPREAGRERPAETERQRPDKLRWRGREKETGTETSRDGEEETYPEEEGQRTDRHQTQAETWRQTRDEVTHRDAGRASTREGRAPDGAGDRGSRPRGARPGWVGMGVRGAAALRRLNHKRGPGRDQNLPARLAVRGGRRRCRLLLRGLGSTVARERVATPPGRGPAPARPARINPSFVAPPSPL